MNAQYTLGYSRGNTGGSNEAVTAGNNARERSADVRLRQRLQQLRRAPHLQPERALRRSQARGALARRLGRRRHRQRAQRPAGAGADRPPRHRLRGCGGQCVRTTRRRIAWRSSTRRAAAPRATTRRPDLVPGVDPVHQGRRPALPESGGVRDAAARHVRQPRAQLVHGPNFRQIDMVVAKRVGGARVRPGNCGSRSSTCSTSPTSPHRRHAAERAPGATVWPKRTRCSRGSLTRRPRPARSDARPPRSARRWASARTARSSSRSGSTSSNRGGSSPGAECGLGSGHSRRSVGRPSPRTHPPVRREARTNPPLRARMRNPRLSSSSSTAWQDTTSQPHSRAACFSVRSSPGISSYSARTRRRTSGSTGRTLVVGPPRTGQMVIPGCGCMIHGYARRATARRKPGKKHRRANA